MKFEHAFCETANTVLLTFYIPPKCKSLPMWELKSPTLFIFGGTELVLYQPVINPGLVQTEYFAEFTLYKVSPGRWYSLTGPSRSLSRCDLDAPEVLDEQEDTSNADSLMSLLSDVYAKGDDDLKKAMNKSLTESAGTYLSTNWEDIKDKEIKPEQ